MKTLEFSAKIQILDESELSDIQKKLIAAAKEATKHAYARYSHFTVGAAVLLDNGALITGSNQENAAYPSGLCAERTALFHASHAFPSARVLRLAIVGRSEAGEWTRSVCAPCGACRQVILEVERRGGIPIEILLPSAKGTYVIQGIDTLLPFGFSEDDLADTVQRTAAERG